MKKRNVMICAVLACVVLGVSMQEANALDVDNGGGGLNICPLRYRRICQLSLRIAESFDRGHTPDNYCSGGSIVDRHRKPHVEYVAR